jgi:hypothetical protein
MTAILATVPLLLVVLAGGTDAGELSFPPEVITDAEKIAWVKAEAAKNEAEVLSLPAQPQSLPRLREIARRETELRELAGTIKGLFFLPQSAAAPIIFQIEAQEMAREAEIRRLAAIKAANWPKADSEKITEKRIWIGMTKEQTRLSWGTPDSRSSTTTAAGTTETWSYGASVYLIFGTDGRLAVIQQ